MATDSDNKSVTNTLTSTTADLVTIGQMWPALEITNHDATTTLYVRQDGTTAVSEANGCTPILPSTSKVISAQQSTTTAGCIIVSIVGNGNKYTIEGVN